MALSKSLDQTRSCTDFRPVSSQKKDHPNIRSSDQSPFTILSSLGSNPETAVGFAKRSDPKTGGEREDGSRTGSVACRLCEGERRPVISPAGRHLGPSESRSKAENVALKPSLRGVTLTPPVDPFFRKLEGPFDSLGRDLLV